MVSKEDVEHLAELARLSIGEKEAESFAEQMTSILAHVQKVQEISDEDPFALEQVNVFREDGSAHEEGRYTNDLLANAKKTKGAYIATSKIISND